MAQRDGLQARPKKKDQSGDHWYVIKPEAKEVEHTRWWVHCQLSA